VHGAVIAANLLSGTPAALTRVRERRRDVVALMAPAAVGAAVLASVQGGPAAAAATAVLGGLGMTERRSTKRKAN
jgi:hypothetical protein